MRQKIAKGIAYAALILASAVFFEHLHSQQTTYLPSMAGPSVPTITAGSNVSVTGTWPNFTVNATEPAMVGTSAAIGGSLLVLGGCNTTNVTVTGATTGMVAVTSPVTTQPNGVQWQAAVTAANTVTIYECALLSVTPPSSTFQVRVIP